MRTIKSSEEFFDILDTIKGGAIVTIGYVTSANLNVPIIKKKNPLTNRMKGYNDYSVFQNDENEIGALIKLTSYNFNYRNRKSVHDEYHNRIKPQTNAIRQEFGLPEIQDKNGYKSVMNYGNNGQEVYSGQNEKIFGHSYSPQNMNKPLHISSTIYAVNKNGNIVRQLQQNEIKPYLKAKAPMTGVAQLQKMGADEQHIQNYINKINSLNFKYMNFEANSILYIVATINKEKIVYINQNMTRNVEDIDVNKQDFINVAKEKYKKDLVMQENIIKHYNNIIKENKYNNNMKKNTIRLTEAQLHQLIAESVNNIINENSTDEGLWDTMKSFAGQYGKRGMNQAKQMGQAAANKVQQGYNAAKQGVQNAANTVKQGYNNVKADVQQTAQNARQDGSMKDMQKAFNNFKMAVQKFTQNGGKVNPQLNSRIKGIENMMNQYQSHF